MKLTSKAKFKSVTLTIESKKELANLVIALRHSTVGCKVYEPLNKLFKKVAGDYEYSMYPESKQKQYPFEL